MDEVLRYMLSTTNPPKREMLMTQPEEKKVVPFHEQQHTSHHEDVKERLYRFECLCVALFGVAAMVLGYAICNSLPH